MARLALIFLLLLPMSALAHRVNVFAYAEGDIIHVEARFQKGVPAQDSEVRVSHAKSGREYLQGKTDGEGRFSFPIPEQARADRADLKILLSAGEGHQNEWILTAGEYLPPPAALPAVEKGEKGEKAKKAKVAAANPVRKPVSTAVVPAAPPPQVAGSVPDCPAAPDVTAVVEAAVERKIAPLRQMMLDSQNQDPGLREVVGGIGYLVGIAGLLAYARSRRMPIKPS